MADHPRACRGASLPVQVSPMGRSFGRIAFLAGHRVVDLVVVPPTEGTRQTGDGRSAGEAVNRPARWQIKIQCKAINSKMVRLRLIPESDCRTISCGSFFIPPSRCFSLPVTGGRVRAGCVCAAPPPSRPGGPGSCRTTQRAIRPGTPAGCGGGWPPWPPCGCW
jgi:hypothetical protein